MLSSDIVKLRNVLAPTWILEFGRALHPCFSGTILTVEVGSQTAAANTIPVTGERECLCDPQLRTEAQFMQKKRRQVGKKRDFKMNFS